MVQNTIYKIRLQDTNNKDLFVILKLGYGLTRRNVYEALCNPLPTLCLNRKGEPIITIIWLLSVVKVMPILSEYKNLAVVSFIVDRGLKRKNRSNIIQTFGCDDVSC